MTRARSTTDRRTAACPTPARRSSAGARVRVAAAALALVGLVAGCGVRFETPPTAALSPGVNESARQRASADAAGLEILAADPGADPADPQAALRTAIVAHAAAQLDQLGGVYGSGPARPTGTGASSPSASAGATPAVATPAVAATSAVVTALTQGADQARGDALTVPDGGLARLLASVGAERLLLARQLASAAALPPADLPAVAVPATVPAGVSPSDLSALVAAEDEAGYGFEVIAAQLSGDQRASALERAGTHRARAESWASLAAIARTGLDPRRAAYAVPTGLDQPGVAAGLAQTMEQALAASYASLVSAAEPDSRAGLVDALVEASAVAAAWGAAVPALPGMPDRTTT